VGRDRSDYLSMYPRTVESGGGVKPALQPVGEESGMGWCWRAFRWERRGDVTPRDFSYGTKSLSAGDSMGSSRWTEHGSRRGINETKVVSPRSGEIRVVRRRSTQTVQKLNWGCVHSTRGVGVGKVGFTGK
jgi:hypothetical protein